MSKSGRAVFPLFVLAAWGCTGGSNNAPAPPVTSSFTNVLRNEVPFVAPEAGSIQVNSSAPNDQVATPWLPVPAGAGTVTVVGLLAGTTYDHTISFASSATGVTSLLGTVRKTVPLLPPDLSTYSMAVTPVTSSPGPGYTFVTGAGKFQLAFDAEGRLRWYQRLDPATAECKMQYDGSLTAFVGTTTGFQPVPGDYVRFRSDGTVLATYTTSPDPTETGNPTVYTDNHELLVTADALGVEHLHLLGYELRPLGPGGSVGAWHEILRQRTDGTVEFRWKTWDHFTAADQTEVVPGGTDLDHANSLDMAPNGDYVASFRDLDAVARIDSAGNVVWRLGGKKNQFTFVGDPLGGFSGQHSARLLPNGNLLLYDDGLQHQPQESRAVEYALDTNSMTATLVWEFRHNPPLFTPYVGSVERLANGNTLVGFALLGTVCEVDPRGQLVWQGVVYSSTNVPLFAYRIRRLPSLYEFETP